MSTRTASWPPNPTSRDRSTTVSPVTHTALTDVKADMIILGPGDLFTSIVPSLIVHGVKECLKKIKAPILFILNIMTKFGETHQFTGRDFVKTLEEAIGRPLNGIIYNNRKPSAELLLRYHEQKAKFVELDKGDGW